MAEDAKILLVPVDGSESANDAARYAAHMAERLKVPIRLLFAFPARPLDMFSVPYEAASAATLQALSQSLQNFEELGKETSAEAFAAAKAAMGQVSVPVEEQIVRGDPAQAIVEAAAGELGGLIVIGRRRRSRLGEMFLLGSVSRYVVHHAPCPVLVAR